MDLIMLNINFFTRIYILFSKYYQESNVLNSLKIVKQDVAKYYSKFIEILFFNMNF